MRAVSLLLVALALVPARARAQDGEAQYRALIEEAVVEFDAGRFPEARSLFLRAHDLAPNARTLRGVGMASFEMRDYVEAYRALSSSLDETVRPLTPEQRAGAQAVLARAARFIGVFRVTVTPAATLEVDGGPPLLSRDGRVLLAIGEHELSARAEGHSEERLQVRVHGGEEEELRLTLTPLARGSGEQAAAAATEGSARRSSSSSPRDDTAAHVLLTSGAAAAAGAVALGLASWMTREEQLAICESPPAGYVCDNPSALRTERDVAAALTVGLAALGAGALVVGGVLLSSGRASEPSLSCAPSGLGLACAGRF